MATILKREFAPISQIAWNELDQETARVLRANLAARQVVDFEGPHGWEFGAVNTGRLDVNSQKAAEEVPWGLRKVLPLVEIRKGFKLSQMELDNYARGAKDVDVDPLLDAAIKVAHFEDRAIFEGFADAGIKGIIEASEHDAVALPAEGAAYPQAIGEAVKAITQVGIDGPYALVLGPDAYYALFQAAGKGHGYPPRRVVKDILGDGAIVRCPILDGGVVLSARGGDFELIVGKDLALGYANHDRDSVELFLTESFTFRVLEPRAAVVLHG